MKLCLIVLLIILLFCSVIFCQNNIIENISLQQGQNEILIYPQLNDFFDKDMLGAVNSGMKITFHFYAELYNAKSELITDQEIQLHVRNDIWENQYTITSFNLLKKFEQFQEFKNYILDSIKIGITLNKKVRQNDQIQIILTFSPQKISNSQKEKIREWLKNEDTDTESTLSLNLSKLISFFLTDEKKDNLSIFKTGLITLKYIKNNESLKK